MSVEPYSRCTKQDIGRIVLAEVRRPLSVSWWIWFIICVLLAVVGLGGSTWQIATQGVGVLGVNNYVPWGWDIVHFVFWIGLGHAGTLISAVLLLTGQTWRNPIARGAEQMTLCAVVCAAVFPLVHVGRIWMTWMIAPVPEISGVWPDMASPLMWDVMAVGTYFLLSLCYWYVGLIPDLALLRDCCDNRLKKRYGFFALGWTGTQQQWAAYKRTSVLLAAILTPLVVSVHSVVSFDFAVTQSPGWHQSVFPPYFVIGAIFSGMAMVQLILLCVRVFLRKQGIEGALHAGVFDISSKFVLALSMLTGTMYLWEYIALVAQGKAHAPLSVAFICMLFCNIVVPQVYWFPALRKNVYVIAFVAVCVLCGMWLERFWIVVGSLEQAILGGLAGDYAPTYTDYAMLFGSVGLFVAMYMVTVRLFPFFSICDNKMEKEAGI